MAAEKIFPKGIVIFPKNEKAPDFVKGTMVVTPNDLFTWLKENESLLSEYTNKEGKKSKQIRFQILDGNKGLYLQVDTFKPTPQGGLTNKPADEGDDLPFN